MTSSHFGKTEVKITKQGRKSFSIINNRNSFYNLV